MSDFLLKTVCIGGSLLLTAVVLQLIRKRKLREEYGLLWLGGALLILIVSCLVTPLPLTTVLFIALPLTLAIILSQSVKLSAHQDSLRDLAQYAALLEWRLQQLEKGEPFTEKRPFTNGIPVDTAPFNLHQRESADELLEQ